MIGAAAAAPVFSIQTPGSLASLNGELVAASAASPDDAWAVGASLMAHWNGETWASVTPPLAGTQFSDVTEIASTGLPLSANVHSAVGDHPATMTQTTCNCTNARMPRGARPGGVGRANLISPESARAQCTIVGGPRGGINAWPGKRQGRYGQANDIWGRCVHVEHLEREVGAQRTQVRQLSLLGGARLAN